MINCLLGDPLRGLSLHPEALRAAAELSGTKGQQEVTAKYKEREERLKQQASEQFADLKRRAEAEMTAVKTQHATQLAAVESRLANAGKHRQLLKANATTLRAALAQLKQNRVEVKRAAMSSFGELGPMFADVGAQIARRIQGFAGSYGSIVENYRKEQKERKRLFNLVQELRYGINRAVPAVCCVLRAERHMCFHREGWGLCCRSRRHTFLVSLILRLNLSLVSALFFSFHSRLTRGNIRVYCRVRPLLGDEVVRRDAVCVSFPTEGEVAVVTSKKQRKVFEFDHIFQPGASNEAVFEETAPLITSVLDGFNVCIFAYGQVRGLGVVVNTARAAHAPACRWPCACPWSPQSSDFH